MVNFGFFLYPMGKSIAQQINVSLILSSLETYSQKWFPFQLVSFWLWL